MDEAELAAARSRLVDALTELRTILTHGERKQVSEAATSLWTLVNGFPVSLGQYLAPMDVMMALLNFVNGVIHIPYIANGPDRIPACTLPPPQSWLDKLDGLIRDFGGDVTEEEYITDNKGVIAKRLGIDRGTLNRWIKSGKISLEEVSGQRWRVRKSVVEKLAETCG
jgi:excisionase family DNA binding protein